MFTIINVHTNEAVKDKGDPVLFDEFQQAVDWASDKGLPGREFAIVDVDDIITEVV